MNAPDNGYPFKIGGPQEPVIYIVDCGKDGWWKSAAAYPCERGASHCVNDLKGWDGDDPHTVETYHHDRVLQAANAEIAALRARLDGLVNWANGIIEANEAALRDSHCTAFLDSTRADILEAENRLLKSAIEAAKGGR